MTDPEFMRRLGEIFDRAVDLPQNKRADYLNDACGDNVPLRKRLDALLHLESKRSGFMEDPTVDTNSNSEADALIDEMIGSYKILEQIGEGGCGVVYLAEQRTPVTRKVALKIIKLGMDTKQVIARFESERQALAMMEHPNIARVLDAGATDNGRPYFVMELVRGVLITRFCDDAKLTMRERLELFMDVCAAVQHAHQKGVIHRDLKPNNVLVTMNDDKPMPKIIDFGIAKATGHKLTDLTLFTQYHQIIGTPAYMSPEQAQMNNKDVDTRSDIYALGVLLYELLTGMTPFDIEALMTKGQGAVFRAIQEEEPPRPSTRATELRKHALTDSARRFPCSEVAKDLDWVVMKALEKDRSRRYATANAFAADVRRFLDGRPVAAVPPKKLYRLRKFVRMHRTSTAAVAAVITALLLGLGLSLQSYKKERAANAAFKKALYASDMKVAQTALKLGDFGLVIEKLEAHLPTADGEDLRGWMWSYLYGQVNPDRVEALRFMGVDAVAVSPNGQVAVSGYRDGPRPIELLDGKTLELEMVLGHAILDARGMWFSMGGESLVVEQGSIVTRIDLETKVEQLLQRQGVYPLRLTPDEQHLVGLFQVPDETQAMMHARCYTLDNDQPIAVSTDPYMFSDRIGMFREFHISPNGKWVTLSCADGTVRLLSIPEMEEHLALRVAGNVSAVAWSPDSQTLATGYEFPYIVDLWAVENGERIRRFEDSSSPCYELQFSPDGTRLALSNQGGFLHTWDIGNRSHRSFSSKFSIREFAFYPDGQRIAASGDGRVALWEVGPRSKSDLERDSETHELWNLEFSPDGSLLAVSAADSVVRIYDPKTGKRMKQLGENAESQRPQLGPRDSRLRFSSDGRYLFVDNNDNTASLYDVVTGEPRWKPLEHPGERIDDLSISPDTRWLGTAGSGRWAIWNARNGDLVKAPRRGYFRRENLGDRNPADLVQFSPDSASGLVAIGDGDLGISLVQTGSWNKLAGVTRRAIGSLSFSRDGSLLACGLAKCGISLYQVPSLTLLDTIKGSGGGAVPNVSFSPDGSTLAIPSWGGNIQIWNRKVRHEVGRLMDSGDWIISAKFSQNGKQLVVSTLGKGVQFFQAPGLPAIEASIRKERAAQAVLAKLVKNCRAMAREEREQRFASDPGAVKDWLWSGAIPVKGDPMNVLEANLAANESTLKPRIGETMRIGGEAYTWKVLRQKDYVLDFETMLEKEERRRPQTVYAVSYIESEGAQENLRIFTGSDDLAKIFLNGEMIYQNAKGWIGRDMDEVTGVSLRQGINSLVFKIVNSGGVGNGSVRFTTADGGRVQGISVRLEP